MTTQSRTERRPLMTRIGDRLSEMGDRPGMLFLKETLSHPKMVGAIIPTSRVAVDATLAGVDWERCRLFVEYGPGTGAFTRRVLEKAHPDARVIAIDLNADFIDYLRRSISDRRLSVVRGSAEDVERIIAADGHQAADYVLSGLPFSTLPDGIGDRIVAATRRSLRPGGQFLVYQYSLFAKKLLDREFDQVECDRAWRCVPPLRIMRATRTA